MIDFLFISQNSSRAYRIYTIRYALLINLIPNQSELLILQLFKKFRIIVFRDAVKIHIRSLFDLLPFIKLFTYLRHGLSQSTKAYKYALLNIAAFMYSASHVPGTIQLLILTLSSIFAAFKTSTTPLPHTVILRYNPVNFVTICLNPVFRHLHRILCLVISTLHG